MADFNRTAVGAYAYATFLCCPFGGIMEQNDFLPIKVA
jgi:hypothetical protein